MNGRHLPAGQNMQQDMGRRRPYGHQPYPPAAPLYNGYMLPYNANYYPQPFPPQYHNQGMAQQYNPYQHYGRSPPPQMMPHYGHPPPLPLQPQAPPFTQPQPSPAIAASHPPVIASSYEPSPATPALPPPQTPSSLSTHSSNTLPGPLTPPTPQPTTLETSAQSPPPSLILYTPFQPPLPWVTPNTTLPWPTRRRRKRKQSPEISTTYVELPDLDKDIDIEAGKDVETSETRLEPITAVEETPGPAPETPTTAQDPSEDTESTVSTTPSSTQPPSLPAGSTKSQRAAVPAVPVMRAIQKPQPKSAPSTIPQKTNVETPAEAKSTTSEVTNEVDEIEPVTEEVKAIAPPPKAWATPRAWTGLFGSSGAPTAPTTVNGGQNESSGFGKKNTESLADALRSFNAEAKDSKMSFLEPRGLVNTGNMCYMNSVLQVLVFCTPFYSFIDQVSKKAAHSFKSETPLIDAMIMFMREFSVIDSAKSVEQLRMRLKEGELEQYGDSFTPDFVYDVMRRLPRFVTMQRGHQQDAEEFLGFLLEGLHDECVHVMKSNDSDKTSAVTTPMNTPSSPTSDAASRSGSIDDAWQQVGPKQKASITRSSGTILTGSPVTKIFGGNLRSELRVPGLKDSITLEPYQPLQLDIGSPNIHNIIDALKGLTHSEVLHGDFKSPKGPNVTATKQVFIETVPPVLILHLKRFQYDNTGGTQKIWKKVGYPLELELPKEVFPKTKRSVFAHDGYPKYRLIGVVYHHGKNASGGHYTVDVRRQDGKEWIRLDDTVIKRVRREDVAEGGSEEDPKVLAAALDAHKKDSVSTGNLFSSIGEGVGEVEEDGWKQASGSGKKWSSVVNGASTPKPKSANGHGAGAGAGAGKFSVMDNKVAYLLFYQKI
ncbi:hypothetical protein SBOR_5543 [Sclerotinia borealis F-4128]|uniref:Ubiquitin carboxyl-terminal hydrolase n=1 Tax=Sclerotinia borealis (strain F-4128) TaxID=1432307 RepID=W9CBD3_SCLBF|nr:hypothetical protein SBOR_5543 [Sclerotinia borealis F-4128]